MIPMAPGGGGAMPFPDPPKGDPGAIAGAARTLHTAADDLVSAHGGLRGASAQLESDWQGYAANAYHAAAGGLTSVATAAAQEFRDCAAAVAAYGTALDHAQQEMKRLRHLYDEALKRQAAALKLAQHLAGSITPHTKPAEVTRTNTQIGNCDTQAGDAVSEANGYARRATQVKSDFHQSAGRQQQVLDGARPGHAHGPLGSPFSPTGHPGPGFGAPFTNFNLPGASPGPSGFTPGGLDAYNGVIPVGDPWHSPIPGFGVWMDHITPEAVPTDDLTNVIALLASFGAAGAARDLGGAALKALLESVGGGSAGREVLDRAGSRAFQQTLKELTDDGAAHGEPFRGVLAKARQAEQLARAEAAVSQGAVRRELFKRAIDVISHIRPLPPGVQDGLKAIVDHGSSYLNGMVIKLVSLQSRLNTSGTPASRAAARAIGAILRGIGR